MTLRLFQLARHLGIDTETVLGKCQSEGMAPPNAPKPWNHMSPVSAGMAATIKEWFPNCNSNKSLDPVEVNELPQTGQQSPRNSLGADMPKNANHAPKHQPPRVTDATSLKSWRGEKVFLQLLGTATVPQVERLLRRVGMQKSVFELFPPGLTKQYVEDCASQYVGSPDGRQRVQRRIAEMIESEARKFTDSKEGKDELAAVKGKLLADEILCDGDIINKACRGRIQNEVDRWLRSPAGAESLEFAKKKAIQAQTREMDQKPKSSWVDRVAKGASENV